jgi:hypothetical protein
VITDTTFGWNVFVKRPIYAFVTESGNVITPWLGIKPTEWESKDVEYINKQLARMAKEFGVRCNKDKAQDQIEFTQRALDAVEKQSVRFISQGKDLTTKLANNELEKIRLEKAQEANKLENAALKIRIENNKKAQDSIANASVQIKKVKEVQLEKLRKIN